MIHWVGPGRWFVGFSVDLRAMADAAVAQGWLQCVEEVGGFEAWRLVMAAHIEVMAQQLGEALLPAVQRLGVAFSEASAAILGFTVARAGWRVDDD